MSVVDRHRRQSVALGAARRNSLHSSVINNGVSTPSSSNSNALPSDLQVGARVLVHGENLGTVRYAGPTSFQTGKWVGVELDEPLGKNNGVVQGKRYFECRSNHGVFVRPAHAKVLPPSTKKETAPASPRSDRNSDSPQRPQQDPGRAVKAAARRSMTQAPAQPASLAKRRASMAASTVESSRQTASPATRATRVPQQHQQTKTTTTGTSARRPSSYVSPSSAKSTATTATARTPTTPTSRATTVPATRGTTATPTATKTSGTLSRAATTGSAPPRRKSMYVNNKDAQGGRPRSGTVGASSMRGEPNTAAAKAAAREKAAREAEEARLAEEAAAAARKAEERRLAEEEAREREMKLERERQLQQIRIRQQQQMLLRAQKQEQQRQQQQQESADDDKESSECMSHADDDEDDEDDEDDDDRTPSQIDTEEDSSDKDTPATPADQDDGPVERMVKDCNPGQSQAHHEQQRHQPAYGALATTMPISKSDQVVPLKDYEELRFKLKILETKRQEDRERYREHEKIKEEAQQFLTLRNKLQDKIGELQKDLRDTKRELKETAADKESLESKYNEMSDSLEMMTLDKEVAEERAEVLQQEVDILKDKIEEISVDLDVLKREADILNRPPNPDGADDDQARNSLEIVQLERHNERLREALIRLRDATNEQEAELSTQIKELENENYELYEIKAQYEKVKEKLETAESQIEDLRQRLDDALGAEEMVEQLTERNLALNEKLEEIQAGHDDLEALKELADELEENHVETEKQLQAEIDHRDMLLREQLERLKSAEETNLDYEATIQQFRELVQHLQSDLEHLRQKEKDQQTENHNLASQSQTMMSLNMQLQSTVMKAQAKAIDLELRKLEAAQANDRLSYIQPYLPDAFFKSENDPISCLLLFKRLVFKSELIIKHLDQSHPISEKIMDNVSESLVSVCELRQKAAWLGDLAKRFVTFVKHCTPEEFSEMARVYHDLVGSERRLNALVEFFRTEESNDNESVVDLQRIIAHLEHLAEVYLVQSSDTGNADLFFSLTRAFDMNSDKMMVELTFVKQIVYNANKAEAMTIIEGPERLDYDYMEPLGRLVTETKNCKMVARKLLRQLDDLAEQALTPKAEHLHKFRTMYALSAKLSQFCFETLKQILGYLDNKRTNREHITLGEVQGIIYNKCDDILDISETTMWDGCLKMLKSLSSELATTLKRIEHDNRMDKIATGIPPWVQRASDMKAEVVINHDMERKLQQHSEEIFKLIKDIKSKDQALQEANIRVELLERRMEAAKKDTEQFHALEESLEKAKAQTQMYSEAMENLQTEYEALEQENNQLKKVAAATTQKEDKRLSIPRKPSGYDTSNSSIVEEETVVGELSDAAEYADMHNHMEILKAGIRYLRAENAHLKRCDLARSLKLEQLPPIQGSLNSAAVEIGEEDEEENENDQERAATKEPEARDMVRSLATETRVLLKDLRTASASPKVVALSERGRRSGEWRSMKKTPDYQYQTQQSVLYTLKQRSEQLKDKLKQLQYTTTDNETTTMVHGAIQPLQRPLNYLTQSIAKVQIPRLSSNVTSSSANTTTTTTTTTTPTSRRHCIQLTSAAEFERIHSIFIR